MTSPIVPWMGGKRRLADRLIPLFPPHDCYVEVFAGGAALFFMHPQPAPVEVLNDLNGDLVTLYRVAQNHLEEFVRQFKWALSSRQIFEWQKMTRPETLTDIQRAARSFYLQQHAFGGKISGQTFGTATTGPAINLLRIEENLSAAWQRLAGTYVENLPWLDCAERYDRAHTFFYMDPPYRQTSGYGVDFPFEEYERMANFMRRCKGRVMVSINDHPDIRRAFDGFHFECLDIRYTTANQRHGKADVTGELVVMNLAAQWARVVALTRGQLVASGRRSCKVAFRHFRQRSIEVGGVVVLVSLALWVGVWVLIVRRRKNMGRFVANLLGAFAGFVVFCVFAGVFLPEPTPEQRQAQAEAQREQRQAQAEAERERDEKKAAEKAQEQAREREALEKQDRSVMASIICSNYVEASLKAPKSADFPFDKASGGKQFLGEQRYVIRSYVDAQNSFGAQLRNWYVCKIQYKAGDDADPRSWHLIDLKFES